MSLLKSFKLVGERGNEKITHDADWKIAGAGPFKVHVDFTSCLTIIDSCTTYVECVTRLTVAKEAGTRVEVC